MHRALTAAALLCALALSACQTTASPPVATVTPPIVINTASLPPVVGELQAKVIQACGFQPTAQVAIAVLRSFSPEKWQTAYDTVSTAALGICAAANGGVYASLKRRSEHVERGKYRGVVIKGRFVR